VIVLFLLILWPIAELAALVLVAEAIGWPLTILLLIVTLPLGVWALRHQGRAAFLRLSTAISENRPPGREVLDGALVVIGGVLLIIPGFITDALGVLALLPPTRALMRWLLVRSLHNRLIVRTAGFGTRRYDVDSTARDLDQPRLHQ
jgi:UPF0716 protein FxsA